MADSLGFFKSNKIHISLTYLGGFLSFLPLIVGVDSNLEATSFGSSIRSQLFRDSCVASLALIAPFMFDSVVDMTGLLLGATAEHEPLLKAKSKTGRSEESFFTYTERIPFVLGIMILPVAVLTVTAMDCTNAGLIVSCSRKAQLMLIAGSIATSLCRHEFIVPKSVSLVSIVLFCIGQTVGSFASNRSRLDPLDRSARALYFVNVIFSYCGAFVVLLFCARWLIKFMVVETKNKPLGKAFLQTIKLSDLLSNISAVPESDAHAIKFLNFRAMFVSIIVFWGILSAVVTSKYGDIVNLDATGLFLGVLPYLLLQAAVLGLTIRLAKHEVVQGLLALLDSKKQYVRYISHEIRTPLNAAFLGLKILMDDMKDSSSAEDADRYDTLCDVNVSCVTAIDILNDLLTFEKLESGILELHKEAVPVLSFVEGCVKMFSAQAKSSRIDLVFNPYTCEERSVSDSSESLSLLASDTAVVDRFKLAQVIRNLISNALKFTPAGGKVTVSVSSIPDHPYETQGGISTRATGANAGKSDNQCGDIVSDRGRQFTSGFRDLEEGLSSRTNTQGDSSSIPGALKITVTDTGAGISPENQKKLFKEVVQFNPEKLQAGGGSGFGLYISKSIVDLHGGRVSVYSEGEGYGSTFTIEIPMARDKTMAVEMNEETVNSMRIRGSSGHVETTVVDPIEIILGDSHLSSTKGEQCTSYKGEHSGKDYEQGVDTVDRRESIVIDYGIVHNTRRVKRDENNNNGRVQADNLTNATTPKPKYNILVVDDSKLNRKLLCKLLVGAGHTCDEADDGVSAVEAVKKKMLAATAAVTAARVVDKILQSGAADGHYDAILMDFVMPNLDGPGATRQIRDMGYRWPIFGVTGNGLQSDIDHYILKGADKVFVKPFVLDDFHATMRKMTQAIG